MSPLAFSKRLPPPLPLKRTHVGSTRFMPKGDLCLKRQSGKPRDGDSIRKFLREGAGGGCFFKKRPPPVFALRYTKRLCHRMWLFHLHSTVKIQSFSPVLPSAESMLGAFGGYSFGISRNKTSTIFYDTAYEKSPGALRATGLSDKTSGECISRKRCSHPSSPRNNCG